ncbi:hypothetical protein A5906_04265 [Bradyrhizobium sacchari]|uniref:DUF6894 domain-containing protein n=1 Tax=Bradyrhizobium sacchari TaxID=1399419 RepID=A0A560KMM4_9BRAD|nr:hypothetical protein [Bradyrhizobium sacchari]OPY96473.1 hypothetical protein A5906_04265 [Bradyrhizobium sacchari]TWB67239.1 hypothetical protein FBZ94_101921 [Bradyrhizobium sacchari]TWB84476.1 hypothetical protein FBZ95_101921 [Bradyrhizobium sacchari]
MPRFHFDVHENGRVIPDEDGQELANQNDARKEAVMSGASIARDAFVSGSARQVVVDVREDGAPFLKVSITLEVDET